MMGNCLSSGEEKTQNQDQGHPNENQVEPKISEEKSSKMNSNKRKRVSPPKESKKRKTHKVHKSKTEKGTSQTTEVFTDITDDRQHSEMSSVFQSGSETSRSALSYKVWKSNVDQETREQMPMEVETNADLEPKQGASKSVEAGYVEDKLDKGSRKREQERTIDRLRKDLEKKEKQIEEKEKEIQEMQTKFENQIRSCENQISKLKTEVQSLLAEKDELLTRVSAMAGARLMDNNPNVADLSDGNRPTKLAEKYTELYDNEWTDAFMEAEGSGLDGETSLKLLLHILITTYKVCKKKADSQLKGIHESLFLEPNSAIPPELSKQLKENRKRNHKMYLPQLETLVGEKLQKLEPISVARLNGPSMKTYMAKCLELAWLMCIQDPPVFVDCNIQLRGRQFDKNHYKEYTKSGPLFDYVVWPAMYLQEGGAILCKGTAQCTKSKEDSSNPERKHKTSIPVGAQTLPVGKSLDKIQNMVLGEKEKTKNVSMKRATFNGSAGTSINSSNLDTQESKKEYSTKF